MMSLEKMREIFRRGDHWEVYNSCAEIQPEFRVQNGICVVKKAERSSITFEVVGTMESFCCHLPAASDVTKTGYAVDEGPQPEIISYTTT
jgi:hypothetical protein